MLLAEDDHTLAILLKLGLCRSGFDVLAVRPLGLLRQLGLEPAPDLMIVDLDFAENGGIAALGAIVDGSGSVPVIAISAGSTLTANEALVVGARAHLIKPIRISGLLTLAVALTTCSPVVSPMPVVPRTFRR